MPSRFVCLFVRAIAAAAVVVAAAAVNNIIQSLGLLINRCSFAYLCNLIIYATFFHLPKWNVRIANAKCTEVALALATVANANRPGDHKCMSYITFSCAWFLSLAKESSERLRQRGERGCQIGSRGICNGKHLETNWQSKGATKQAQKRRHKFKCW